MRYVSIVVAFCMVGAGILLAEKKKTAKAPVPKVPKVLKEYTVKKNLKNHVEIVLKIKKKQLAGDPILLNITLNNKGKKQATHGYTNFYRDFRIIVKEPSGKEVPFTKFGKHRIGKTRKIEEVFVFDHKPLAPGQSYCAIFNLSLLFDLTLPGTYRVSVAKEIDPFKPTEFTLEVSGLEFKVSEPRPVIRVRGPATAPARQKDTPKK